MHSRGELEQGREREREREKVGVDSRAKCIIIVTSSLYSIVTTDGSLYLSSFISTALLSVYIYILFYLSLSYSPTYFGSLPR